MHAQQRYLTAEDNKATRESLEKMWAMEEDEDDSDGDGGDGDMGLRMI